VAIWAAPVAVAGFIVCAYGYAELSMDSIAGGGAARTSPLFSLALTVARASLVAVVLIGPAVWAKPFASRPSRLLAEYSYGIYLIHWVVATYVGLELLGLPRDGTLGTIALWIVVVIPPSLGFAYLTTRFVERPARAWAARRPAEAPPARSPKSLEPEGAAAGASP
jgi:peptidoglycan/LPS O-acetylase OafA/YrhL